MAVFSLAVRHHCGGSMVAVRRHGGMARAAAIITVLPLHAGTVAMKTPVATAMAGAQTISNQLKAATATASTMTATMITIGRW